MCPCVHVNLLFYLFGTIKIKIPPMFDEKVFFFSFQFYLDIRNVDWMQIFSVCYLPCCEFYTLYIKSQITGTFRKTTKILKPSVAMFQANIYLSPFLSWFALLYITDRKSVTFGQRAEALIQRSWCCQKKYDLLFASFSFQLAHLNTS